MSGSRYCIVVCAVLGLAACNRARVDTTESYLGPAISRPDHVLVSYFSVMPGQVQLDRGVSARITRAFAGGAPGSQQISVAEVAQTALAQRMVDRLRSYGLQAEITPPTVVPGRNLLVQGQFVSINQGNRTRRTLVGLGAGESTVSADAQLYYASGEERPRFVTAFSGEADSGRAPGAAETMGVGAAAERLGSSAALTSGAHVMSETRGATDTDEAGRLADRLGQKIGQFAVSQGWIPASAIK